MDCGHQVQLNILHTIFSPVCQVAVAEPQGPLPVPWNSLLVLNVRVKLQVSVVVNWTVVLWGVLQVSPMAIDWDESRICFDPYLYSRFR